MLAYEVLFERLVGGFYPFARLVQQRDQVRKSITEETTEAHGNVDARAAKLCQRNSLDTENPAVFFLPDWAHAEQCQDFGHVVAVGPHGAGAPDADADCLRISSRFPVIA